MFEINIYESLYNLFLYFHLFEMVKYLLLIIFIFRGAYLTSS